MYLIRADGNARIGAGHMMRCLTIADELSIKEQVYFICADEQSAQMARSRGYAAFVLGTDYRNMEAELPGWETLFYGKEGVMRGPKPAALPADGAPGITANTMSGGGRTAAREQNAGGSRPVILVDSYHTTDRYLQALRRYGLTAVLDDEQRKAFPADTVINYHPYCRKAWYEENYNAADTALCLGSDYAPIRRQFTEAGQSYRLRGEVRDVLITTGGGDSDNIAGKILQEIYDDKLNYHLIIGRYNPHFEEMKKLQGRLKSIHIYHDVRDMAGLMARCDAAVTAAGTTVYELAAVGVPFICFSYAENQEQLAAYIGRRRIAPCGGRYHERPGTVLAGIAGYFQKFREDPDIRNACYEKEKRMIDGNGAGRVAGILARMADTAHWPAEKGRLAAEGKSPAVKDETTVPG